MTIARVAVIVALLVILPLSSGAVVAESVSGKSLSGKSIAGKPLAQVTDRALGPGTPVVNDEIQPRPMWYADSRTANPDGGEPTGHEFLNELPSEWVYGWNYARGGAEMWSQGACTNRSTVDTTPDTIFCMNVRDRATYATVGLLAGGCAFAPTSGNWRGSTCIEDQLDDADPLVQPVMVIDFGANDVRTNTDLDTAGWISNWNIINTELNEVLSANATLATPFPCVLTVAAPIYSNTVNTTYQTANQRINNASTDQIPGIRGIVEEHAATYSCQVMDLFAAVDSLTTDAEKAAVYRVCSAPLGQTQNGSTVDCVHYATDTPANDVLVNEMVRAIELAAQNPGVPVTPPDPPIDYTWSLGDLTPHDARIPILSDGSWALPLDTQAELESAGWVTYDVAANHPSLDCASTGDNADADEWIAATRNDNRCTGTDCQNTIFLLPDGCHVDTLGGQFPMPFSSWRIAAPPGGQAFLDCNEGGSITDPGTQLPSGCLNVDAPVGGTSNAYTWTAGSARGTSSVDVTTCAGLSDGDPIVLTGTVNGGTVRWATEAGPVTVASPCSVQLEEPLGVAFDSTSTLVSYPLGSSNLHDVGLINMTVSFPLAPRGIQSTLAGSNDFNGGCFRAWDTHRIVLTGSTFGPCAQRAVDLAGGAVSRYYIEGNAFEEMLTASRRHTRIEVFNPPANGGGGILVNNVFKRGAPRPVTFEQDAASFLGVAFNYQEPQTAFGTYTNAGSSVTDTGSYCGSISTDDTQFPQQTPGQEERGPFFHDDASNHITGVVMEGNDFDCGVVNDLQNVYGPHTWLFKNRVRDRSSGASSGEFKGTTGNSFDWPFVSLVANRFETIDLGPDNFPDALSIMNSTEGGVGVSYTPPTSTGSVSTDNEESTAQHTLALTTEYPGSLIYRTGVPEWWCQESGDFDAFMFGAFDDTTTPVKNPAQIRNESGTCTPVATVTALAASSPILPHLDVFSFGRSIRYMAEGPEKEDAYEWFSQHHDMSECIETPLVPAGCTPGVDCTADWRDAGSPASELRSHNANHRCMRYGLAYLEMQGSPAPTPQPSGIVDADYLHLFEATTLQNKGVGEAWDDPPPGTQGLTFSPGDVLEFTLWTDLRRVFNLTSPATRAKIVSHYVGIFTADQTAAGSADAHAALYIDEDWALGTIPWGVTGFSQDGLRNLSGGTITEYNESIALYPGENVFGNPLDTAYGADRALLLEELADDVTGLGALGVKVVPNFAGSCGWSSAFDLISAARGAACEQTFISTILNHDDFDTLRNTTHTTDGVCLSGGQLIAESGGFASVPGYTGGSYGDDRERDDMWRLAATYLLMCPTGQPGRVTFDSSISQSEPNWKDRWRLAYQVNVGAPTALPTLAASGTSGDGFGYEVWTRTYENARVYARFQDPNGGSVAGDPINVTTPAGFSRQLMGDASVTQLGATFELRPGEGVVLLAD